MKLKRTLAAIIAATTMAVGISSIAANAVETIWYEDTDSGNLIYAEGHVLESLIGEGLSKSAYGMTLNVTHTTAATAADQVLVSIPINDCSTTRYMGSSVMVKDYLYNTFFSTTKYSSGDIAPHGTCTVSNTVSNSSLGSGRYWLYYSGTVHGGTSYHAAVQSEVEIYEYYEIN